MFKKNQEEKAIAKAVATKYFRKNSYKLLAKDFITNESSIDFVYRDKETKEIVFVYLYVSNNYLDEYEKENYLQSRKIYSPIKWYIEKHNLFDEFVRVDLLQISIHDKKAHIKQFKSII